MRTFVITDIHGAHKALIQCLNKVDFDYKNDRLICLGDVADGWPEVQECFDELMKIKNLIFIIGNHDAWLLNWFTHGIESSMWLQQGGDASLESYDYKPNIDHKLFLDNALDYFIDENNNLFLHGGYKKEYSYDIENQGSGWDYRYYDGDKHTEYNWNRNYWECACIWEEYKHEPEFDTDYNTVFLGHTPTIKKDSALKPIKSSNVWNLDQGAGYGKKLTIMNVETEEYWQSDMVSELYPNHDGRKMY